MNMASLDSKFSCIPKL